MCSFDYREINKHLKGVLAMDFSTEDLNPRETYKLLSGSVIPRPIAFVSTRNINGIYNLAPFSFFNAVSSQPPIVMFSVNNHVLGYKKDTQANIEATNEFVVNIVSEDIAESMNNASAEFLPEVSEFQEVGLTPVPAKRVNCMAVSESPIHLECTLYQTMEIGKNVLIFGKVVHFHIADHVYIEPHKINVEALRPIARIAGNGYTVVRDQFTLEKQVDSSKIRNFG